MEAIEGDLVGVFTMEFPYGEAAPLPTSRLLGDRNPAFIGELEGDAATPPPPQTPAPFFVGVVFKGE